MRRRLKKAKGWPANGWIDINREGYDVVIRIGTIKDSGLIMRKLGECPIWLCASPKCLEENRPIQDIDTLKDFPAITYSQHGRKENWVYGNRSVNGSVKLNSCFSANSAELQMEACLAGLGVALLPAFTAYEALDSGSLVRVLPEFDTLPKRDIVALFPANRAKAARVRLFIDSLVTAFNHPHWKSWSEA